MPAEPAIETPGNLFGGDERVAAGPTRPIAGGTDLMVAITGELGPISDRMLDLSRIDALRGITLESDALVLGARTTYSEMRRSAVCREHLPALVDAAATIGAAQIQNRGTIGGNAANASPAGDTLPVLLAVDASFVVGGPRGERTIRADAFWVAYRRTALAPDELILRIRIPLVGGREMRFRKIGTRRAQAISKVVMALAWRDPGGPGPPPGSGVRRPELWRDVRLALGSVADRPIRATATEAVLEGRPPTPQ